jgi:intracellular sulfur oxidation DsrE/DsrF family protein
MNEPLTLEVLEADHAKLVEAIGAKAIAERDDATVIEQLKADKSKLAAEVTSLKEHFKAIATNNIELVEKIDAFEAVEKLANQKTEVDALIEAAKLPEVLVTDVFRESMLNADEDRRKALIEDRQAMAKLTEGGKPRSREQGVTEGETKVANTKEFVALIT